MSGHSHSANIARRKNAVDAQRARIFSKCARHVMSAVRQGGPDVTQNLKLRYAVEKARAANMPKDNIERAIKRASGEGAGDIEELTYEGYAAGGVAMIVTCLTDNRNRTAADVKHIFEKRGGNLGAQGSVAFMFDFRSVFVIETGDRDEEAMLEVALEIGAEDVEYGDEWTTILAGPGEFLAVKDAMEPLGFEFVSAETGYVARESVPSASREDAGRLLKLIETLEEHEDVQNVYTNCEIPDEWIEAPAD